MFDEKAQCCHLFSSIVSVQNEYLCTRIAYRNDTTYNVALGIFSQSYAVLNVHTCVEKVNRDILIVPCFEHSSFLGLRLKVNEPATAGKTLVSGIGQKGLFLQIVTFQIFFSASIECQPTISVHCIDHCKVNL